MTMTTLHYHRAYQISSLEANLSLEDMKYETALCRQKPHSQGYTPYPLPPSKKNKKKKLVIIKSDLF